MKKGLLIAFMIFLMFFAACKKQETTTLTGRAYVGGNQGLQLEFLPSQPPANVFDVDSPFTVGLKVENKGEWDISNGGVKFSITGINAADFGVTVNQLNTQSSEELEGVGIDSAGAVVLGDYITVDFPEMNYFKTISGSIPFTIRANACYNYGTNVQGKICVREDLRGIKGEAGICDPNRAVPSENSGAPVQISNFKQNVAGSNKIDFTFTITKVGPAGDTLHKLSTDCSYDLVNRDVVYLEVEDSGLGALTCSGLRDGTATSGYITLFNNQREVRCSQTIDNLDDFEKIINIKITYGYKQFVDKQVNVKHAS